MKYQFQFLDGIKLDKKYTATATNKQIWLRDLSCSTIKKRNAICEKSANGRKEIKQPMKRYKRYFH